MSLKALSWAFDVEAIPSSNKLVLLALANYASETGKAYPSVETVCRITCQQDSTVRRALENLIAIGIIEDTGSRVGNTQQVKVYQLPEPCCERPPKTGVFKKSKTHERPPKDPCKTPERPPKTGGITSNGSLLTENQGEVGANALPAVLVAALPEEVAVWNSKVNLRKVQAMSSGRMKALKARRSDPYFTANWRTAVDRVAASSFCNGENDRGWKADFDFFLRPDTVVKIMEGKYDNRVQTKKSGFGQLCP